MKDLHRGISKTTDTASTTLEQFSRNYQNEVLKRARGEVRDLQNENSKLRARIELLERIDAIAPSPPKWAVKATQKGLHAAIPTLLLSDCHFDEVVRPSEVEGVNEYNREIAIKRLQRLLVGTIEIARFYLSGMKYEGFTLLLGGDLLSGNIHEELEQTNEDTIPGSVDFWTNQLIPFVGSLADEFKHLYVIGVVGNHGRLSRKPRAKLRVRDNFDWLLYRNIARAFSKDARITWQIPESADCAFKLYETSFRLSHGDQFRGGSGISGMMSPILLGHYRKQQRQGSLKKPFDWLCIGHWHQYFVGRGIIANGSLKGYDEWAYLNNFGFERSQQAFFVTTPQNGVSFPIPIFGDERE